MSTYHRIVVTTSLTAAEVSAILAQNAGDPATMLRHLSDWQRGSDGNRIGQTCSAVANVGAAYATATLTSTGAAVADETFVLCGVTFTAKNSGTAARTFVVSGTVATQASHIASAINAASELTNICSATSLAGVVTITAAVPGAMGNGLVLSESLTNVTAVTFANGSDGTASTYSGM